MRSSEDPTQPEEKIHVISHHTPQKGLLALRNGLCPGLLSDNKGTSVKDKENNCFLKYIFKIKEKSCVNKKKTCFFSATTKSGKVTRTWGLNCHLRPENLLFYFNLARKCTVCKDPKFCSALPQIHLSSPTTVILITAPHKFDQYLSMWSNRMWTCAWLTSYPQINHLYPRLWAMVISSPSPSSNYKESLVPLCMLWALNEWMKLSHDEQRTYFKFLKIPYGNNKIM